MDFSNRNHQSESKRRTPDVNYGGPSPHSSQSKDTDISDCESDIDIVGDAKSLPPYSYKGA